MPYWTVVKNSVSANLDRKPQTATNCDNFLDALKKDENLRAGRALIMLHAVSVDYGNTSDKHLIKRNKIPVVFHPLSTTYIQT